MAAKLLLLVACVALCHGALVKRDAPTANPLDDFKKHAEDLQKTMAEQINTLVNSKSVQDATKTFKENTESLQQNLGNFATSLSGAIEDASGKSKEALLASKANLERVVEDLRKAHPEVDQQANALKEKFTSAMQNGLQETQKLAKQLGEHAQETNEKLAPKVQAAFNDFLKQTQEVGKKLHEAATKQ